jgi:hypothetical protein
MMASITHQHRFYRDRLEVRGLVPFAVAVQETDLFILAESSLADRARESILNYRYQLEAYIRQHPPFLKSFSPLPPDPLAPPMIRDMLRAAAIAGVGPMAAVAGAFAETVGSDLLQYSGEIVVENGGDLYLKVNHDITIGIYAGASPISNRLALRIHADTTPVGVCTSSGTVGHSFSFGRADAVTIIAASAFLADAAATSVGNCVSASADIPRGLERAQSIDGVRGAVIIINDQMGACGDVELVSR